VEPDADDRAAARASAPTDDVRAAASTSAPLADAPLA
jgi:hypothetical protein